MMNQFARELIREAKRMEDFRFLGITQKKRNPHYRLHLEEADSGDDFFFVVPSTPRNPDAELNNLHPRVRRAYRRHLGR